MERIVVVVCIGALIAASRVEAAPVAAGTTSLPMFPIQDVILPAMSAFNTLAEDVLADDVTAKGASIFTRQAQVGSTILLTDGNFFGTGTHPLLGRFELLTGAAYGFDPMTARLENVVQDASHPGFATGDPASVISADLVEFVVPNYGVNLLDLGVSLEVRDSFYFTSTFDGLPPSPGTPYTADPYEGPTSMLPAYLAGTNEVVAYSTQRRLEALPEPSAGALFVTALGVAKFFSRRRVVVGR